MSNQEQVVSAELAAWSALSAGRAKAAEAERSLRFALMAATRARRAALSPTSAAKVQMVEARVRSKRAETAEANRVANDLYLAWKAARLANLQANAIDRKIVSLFRF